MHEQIFDLFYYLNMNKGLMTRTLVHLNKISKLNFVKMTFGQRASKQVVSNLIYSKINFLTKVMLKTLKLLLKIFENFVCVKTENK